MKNFTQPNTIVPSESIIELSSEILNLPDKSDYPVLKIDTQGKILYANNASFQYLRDWFDGQNSFLPKYIIHFNPEILDPDANFSISITVEKDVMNFDVIGFKECGFIGLYGFNSFNIDSKQNRVSELHNA